MFEILLICLLATHVFGEYNHTETDGFEKETEELNKISRQNDADLGESTQSPTLEPDNLSVIYNLTFASPETSLSTNQETTVSEGSTSKAEEVVARTDDSAEDNKSLLHWLKKMYNSLKDKRNRKKAVKISTTTEIAAPATEITPPTMEMTASTIEMTPSATEMTASTIEMTAMITDMSAPTIEITAVPTEMTATTINNLNISKKGLHEHHRRMMDWFNKLIKGSEPSSTSVRPFDKTNSTESNNQHETARDRSQACDSLHTVLDKLNNVLTKINGNLEEVLKKNKTGASLTLRMNLQPNNRDGFYSPKLRRPYKDARFKRDLAVQALSKSNASSVENTTGGGSTNAYNGNGGRETLRSNEDDTFSKVNTSTTRNNHQHLYISQTTTSGATNDGIHNTVTTNDDNSNEHDKHDKELDTNAKIPENRLNKSGRRFNNEDERIKNRLISHISYSFQEIKEKLAPLNKLKKLYGNDKGFKIGYIAANLDTLEVNMRKLNEEMVEHKRQWDEMRILNLLERFSVSNHVIDELMKALKLFTEPVKVETVLHPMVGYNYLDD